MERSFKLNVDRSAILSKVALRMVRPGALSFQRNLMSTPGRPSCGSNREGFRGGVNLATAMALPRCCEHVAIQEGESRGTSVPLAACAVCSRDRGGVPSAEETLHQAANSRMFLAAVLH